MEWSKIDAGLAAALADDEAATGRHRVFVHLAAEVDPAEVDPTVLADLGVPAGDARVRTAELTAAEIDRLSDQEWVSQLRSSWPLRPAGDPPPR